MLTSHLVPGLISVAREGAPSGPFDTVLGLPVHPLVVHGAVVLLPLAALGLIAIVAIPKLRKPLGWLVLAGLLVATGAAWVAKESGQQLAARVGEPQAHAELGDPLPIMAAALLVVAAIWFLLARAAAKTQSGTSPAARVIGIVAILVAALNLVWVVRVGHSGAEAVWAAQIQATNQAAVAPAGPAASPSPTVSGSSSPSTSASATATPGQYTMANVKAHATAADCWTAIDAKVYDLTAWGAKHPGGLQRIVALCGIDGTSAFRGQHGSQAKPNDVLGGFQIGTLG